MKKTTFIKLLFVYTLWLAVALLQNKKSPSKIKEELNNTEDKDIFLVIYNNFIEIHKNLFESIKKSLITKENKDLFNEKKELLLNTLDEYNKKAKDIFEEYKEKWADYKDEWIEKLEDFYKNSKNKIDDIDLNKGKEKFLSYIEDLKSKLKK